MYRRRAASIDLDGEIPPEVLEVTGPRPFFSVLLPADEVCAPSPAQRAKYPSVLTRVSLRAQLGGHIDDALRLTQWAGNLRVGVSSTPAASAPAAEEISARISVDSAAGDGIATGPPAAADDVGATEAAAATGGGSGARKSSDTAPKGRRRAIAFREVPDTSDGGTGSRSHSLT